MNKNKFLKNLNRDSYDNSIFIINYFSKNNKEVTFQKLNRLLYLLEAIFMVATEEDYLFNDDFYAFNFEISNKKVVNNFKKYSSFAIDNNYDNIEIPKINKIFIESLFNIFGQYTTAELISFTIMVGSPIHSIMSENNKYINKTRIIEKEKTKKWFESLVEVDERKCKD